MPREPCPPLRRQTEDVSFPGARRKLDEARRLAVSLERAPDAPTFRTLFSAFLSAAKATVDSLRKDGAKRPGFRKWHDARRAALRSDELMRFAFDARDQDLHEGRHRLLFSTHVEHFNTADAGEPPTGYPADMEIGNEGPVWVIDRGKPSERREPIHAGGTWITSAQIHEGPRQHRGGPFNGTDPLKVCSAVVAYLAELVYEAETRFRDT